MSEEGKRSVWPLAFAFLLLGIAIGVGGTLILNHPMKAAGKVGRHPAPKPTEAVMPNPIASEELANEREPEAAKLPKEPEVAEKQRKEQTEFDRLLRPQGRRPGRIPVDGPVAAPNSH